MTIVSLIAAMAKNRAIGIDNRLPWRLPEDLAHFKRTTLGKPIVMGRKTWESLGRPLPGRLNIVVTRNPGWHAEGCVATTSLDAALAAAGAVDEVFVIGGAELYGHALERADRLYLTEIGIEVAGDAFFPELDRARWREAWCEDHANADFRYRFVRYERA